jgi:hypothetical protein
MALAPASRIARCLSAARSWRNAAGRGVTCDLVVKVTDGGEAKGRLGGHDGERGGKLDQLLPGVERERLTLHPDLLVAVGEPRLRTKVRNGPATARCKPLRLMISFGYPKISN